MLQLRWETKFKEMENGYEIPYDWEEKTIDQVIVSLEKGKTPKNIKGKYPYFSAKFLRGEENIIGKFGQEAGVFVKEDDIVILWDGANSGEVFKGKSGVLASTMCRVEFDDSFNKGFLYLVLKAREDELKDSKSGTDDRHLDKDYFYSFPIQHPSIKEQSRIATILSWFDDLIENKKKQNEILEKTAMAIFKSWFIDFEPFKDEEFVDSELGKIPKGWQVKSFSDIATVVLGGTPRREKDHYWNGKIKWASARDVASTKGIYVIETMENISEEGLNNSNAKILPKNTTIITARGTVGEIRLLGEEISFNQTCYGLKPKNGIDEYFLFLSLKYAINLIKAISYGTVFDTITIKNFEEMKTIVAHPPILNKFSSLAGPIFQKILLNQKQIMLLRKVRDALLPLLVFGKIRVEEI